MAQSETFIAFKEDEDGNKKYINYLGHGRKRRVIREGWNELSAERIFFPDVDFVKSKGYTVVPYNSIIKEGYEAYFIGDEIGYQKTRDTIEITKKMAREILIKKNEEKIAELQRQIELLKDAE